MTNEEFIEKIKGTELEEYVDCRLDDVRRIYEMCDDLGASFVRVVATAWRAQDDARAEPRDRHDARGYLVPMGQYNRDQYPLRGAR